MSEELQTELARLQDANAVLTETVTFLTEAKDKLAADVKTLTHQVTTYKESFTRQERKLEEQAARIKALSRDRAPLTEQRKGTAGVVEAPAP